jgi:uncharacterized phiE125 gp8 family phage protein
MRMSLVTANTEEALTLEEAKDHLRIGSDMSDDARIARLIVAARLDYERFTNRILMSSTWDAYFDSWPEDGVILLPGPVTSVTSIKYQDTSDTEQTWTSSLYVKDLVSEPARITLAYGQSWPLIYYETNNIVIRFVSGYANAGSVPEDIKNGLYFAIQAAYDADTNMTSLAESFWWAHRWVPV